jgi:hypothetical protein
MVLYEGAAADVVGVCICFLLVRGHRSCGIIVGMPGGQIRRVYGKLLGWGHSRVVCGQETGSQIGVGTVAGLALGTVAGVMLMA